MKWCDLKTAAGRGACLMISLAFYSNHDSRARSLGRAVSQFIIIKILSPWFNLQLN